jgi:hypothetical protein
MPRIPNLNRRGAAETSIPLLRGGIRGTIRPAARTASVHPSLYWEDATVPAFTAADLTACCPPPAQVTDPVIPSAIGIVSESERSGDIFPALYRSIFARLCANVPVPPAAAGGGAAAAGGAGGVPVGVAGAAGVVHPAGFSSVLHIAAAVADPTLKLRAMTIAAARTATIVAWNPLPVDILPSESQTTPIYLASWVATPQRGDMELVWDSNPAADPAYLTMADAAPDLTAAESDFVSMILLMSIAAAPFSGMVLEESTHHYQPGSDIIKRHAAVEKQVLREATPAAKLIWDAHTLVIQFAMWHSAIHPLSITWMKGLAADVDVPHLLVEAGLGSAAVPLPSREGTIHRAESYLAVMNTVGPLMRSAGHALDHRSLQDAIFFVKAFPKVGAPPAVGSVGFPTRNGAAPGVSALVVDRDTAIRYVLLPTLEVSAPVAAYCFGWLGEALQEAGIREGQEEGSLLRSYALKNCAKNHVASRLQGTKDAQLADRAKRTAASNNAVLPTVRVVDWV